MSNDNLELLTCQQVADFLGVKVDTIYRKLGRKPIFIKSAVEEWILNGAEMVKGGV